MNNVLKSGLVLGLVALTGNVFAAGTATSNLTVSSTVTANCLIDSSLPLAFGNYDPIVANPTGVPLDASTTVDVTCTSGITGATLSAGNGLNFGSGSRQLIKGGDLLPYAIYSDAGRTTAFAAEALTATGTPQSVSLYGRIDGGQNVPVGVYSDTVIMTANF